MHRSLVIVTALCLCSTSSSALTAQECRAKYKAAQATGSLRGESWHDFQEKQCGLKPESARRKPAPQGHSQGAN